jgi:hypothetical protein
VTASVTRAWLWLVGHSLNHVTTPLARAGRGPWSLVRRVGRRSGTPYETPVLLRRTEGGFVVELTYGPGVDWYRNITAAGRCTVVHHGREYAVDAVGPCPEIVGLAAFPGPARLLLKALRRTEFRRLHVAAS